MQASCTKEKDHFQFEKLLNSDLPLFLKIAWRKPSPAHRLRQPSPRPHWPWRGPTTASLGLKVYATFDMYWAIYTSRIKTLI